MAGMTCVAATGKCAADPCLVTRCRGGDTCVVSPTGEARCEQPAGTSSTRQTFRVGTTGGGLTDCDCNLGGARARGPGGSTGVFVAGLAAVGLALRRRRRTPKTTSRPR
jgi:hypothetical protein